MYRLKFSTVLLLLNKTMSHISSLHLLYFIPHISLLRPPRSLLHYRQSLSAGQCWLLTLARAVLVAGASASGIGSDGVGVGVQLVAIDLPVWALDEQVGEGEEVQVQVQV
jgi:hypothetical protein